MTKNKCKAASNVLRPAFNRLGLADTGVACYLKFQDAAITLYLQ